jgi:hypothetical protein
MMMNEYALGLVENEKLACSAFVKVLVRDMLALVVGPSWLVQFLSGLGLFCGASQKSVQLPMRKVEVCGGQSNVVVVFG